MKILLLTLISLTLHAETVYMTSNGKTFHKDTKCVSLSRAKVIRSSEHKDAEQHNLKPCGICYKKSQNSWAKEVK